ncbi:periplasmic binding protein [Methanocaldococcus vulcanius M7]|uniref:Periplasmic binding protein n=1 Tax=Methanocaldococcus vulcanius (strain ATCC 700851 / DSM 12094 / M7) TaxID=579137 RepID=C9RGB2_METVM|nr:ABC transporter substrate-binding protein [Methanocaldococcus vulcanius]ACX72614.1 periplasmic binding protein [Methanocaldococcus vulcanius M7]
MTKKSHIFLSFMVVCLLVGLSGCVKNNNTPHYKNETSAVKFAEKFELYPHWNEGYCLVVDSEGNKFLLVEGNNKTPNISAKVIKVPVKKIVTDFYCPIISTADILHAYHNTIVGAPKYAIEESPTLKRLYKEGKVVDIGSPGNINYELVANLSPDVVFLSGWKSEDEVEEKLKELGIPVSRFHTYEEPTYMGRVEWIKFAAAFWGKNAYDNACKWFNGVVSVRENIIKKVKNSTEPTVVIFSWSKYRNMPGIYGNESYYSRMIADFNGKNVFSNCKCDFQYVDKETFFEKARNADVVIMLWYYNENISNKSQLLNISPEFAELKAFKTGRFYISHSDYYVWEARDPSNYMLDFAKMLHPELFGEDNNLKYFYKVS